MEEMIVVSMSTSLTFTMTEELYGRLADRLRHVIQFSEASQRAAEEVLALLEAAKEKEVRVDARDTPTGDQLGQTADAPDEQLDEAPAELEAASDVDAVIYLLAMHELVEDKVHGKARYLAQAEAMAIIAALNRFAPAALHGAGSVGSAAAFGPPRLPVSKFVKAPRCKSRRPGTA
jgi:hypothetical protein